MSTIHRATYDEPAALRTWRVDTFHLIVRVLLIVSLPGLVSETIGGIQYGRYSVLIIGLFFYLALAICTFVRRIPDQLRKACLLFVTGGMGLFLLLRMGLVGAGRIYLYSFALYAALLLSWRFAVIAWGTVLTMAALIFTATITGIIPLAPDVGQRITDPATIITNGLVLFSASGMAIFIIRSLIGQFAASLYAAEQARAALAASNVALERLVAERTAELQTEQRLLAVERQYNLVLRTLPDLFWLKDAQSRYLLGSDAFFAFHGLTPEALIGRTADEAFPPEVAAGIRLGDALTLTGRARHSSEAHVQDSQGRYVWLSTTKAPIYNEDGSPFGILGISHDVTDRKQAELALERQLSYAQATARCAQLLLSSGAGEQREWSWVAEAIEHLRGAVGASRIFVYQYNYDVTPPAFALIAEAVAPDGIPFKIPSGDWSVVPDAMLAAFKAHRPFGGSVSTLFAVDTRSRDLLEANGVRVVLTVPIYVGERLWGHMGIIDRERDSAWDEVTTQLLVTAADMVAAFVASRDSAEGFVRAKNIAEAASRAKSTFLAHMSHEIRTPLNAVIGISDLLVESAPTDEQRHYAETIHTAGASLLAIINNILDLAKIESGHFELDEQPFDIRVCLRSAADMVAYDAARKGLAFNLHVDPAVPATLLGDNVRLRQVVINLLANAVKFTERGSVRLEATREQSAEGEHLLCISIHDTGPGITTAEHSHIFEAFVQAGSTALRRSGTGLGLTISRQIIDAMGGTITVASRSGPGATFAVTLPLLIASGVTHPRPTPSGQAPLSPLRVLLAEDNPINQEVARLMLAKLGATVVVVSNGRAAVNVARRETFDVVLMDIEMPEMDGAEAARQIYALSPPDARPYVVALTAHALAGDRQRYYEAGFDDYLSKPVQLEGLRAVLARISARPTSTVEAQEIDWRQLGQTVGLPDPASASRRGRRILRLFSDEIAVQIAKLAAAIEREDRHEVRLAAHRLLGSARQLGTTALARACNDLEVAAEAAPRAQLEAGLERLRGAYARARAMLAERYPDELGQAEPVK
ncbi:MAG: response regulator [Chloroflexales bacterium]|nr:response regulator [Chloroflexales bacterium]